MMDAPGLSAYYPYSLNPVSGLQGLRLALAGNFPVPTIETQNQTHEPTPWRTTTCASCSSELDCRLKDEYCSSSGCCRRGECVQDDDCVQQHALDHYFRIEGFESLGSNINPMNPQNDLSLVQKLCDVNPDCVGFNSYGLLKYNIAPPHLWTPQPSTAALPELVPWALYIKKTATQGRNPKVKLPANVKQYCILAPPGGTTNVTGLCRQCIGCTSDNDCPDATMCNTKQGCCVNNPCYVATPEDGKWVDGRYARENQCECAPDQPYCCLRNREDIHSAFCSKQPCEQQEKVRACSYICEDAKGKHDAVICKANQHCCNQGDGPPVCCSGACGSGGGSNQCLPSTGLIECKAAPGTPYESAYCTSSQLCCNDAKAPPVCCNRRDLGCYKSATQNGCNSSDLTTDSNRFI